MAVPLQSDRDWHAGGYRDSDNGGRIEFCTNAS